MTKLEQLILSEYQLKLEVEKLKQECSLLYGKCVNSGFTLLDKEITEMAHDYSVSIPPFMPCPPIAHQLSIAISKSNHEYYSYDEVFGNIACEHCNTAYSIKHKQMAPLKKKLGIIRRQITNIAKKLQIAANAVF